MFDPFTILDIKVVLEEAETPPRQASDALLVCLEPLERLMVCNDYESL